ncbi:hypothetical protein CVT24_004549 [Panaeolus cyanescens]|uniref:Vacuolar sorting protein Vps3844 C-terminal domain-containing protein n=1 Tax=Panaeolus cyanescens TaxID=181874 RepID=A0A409VA24_9AGAR|nr:hypothetical protein CVT24_004549 [Panaeolus cyanescens]
MFISLSLPLLLSASIHLSQAVNIYLSPSTTQFRSSLSPDEASAALSTHLGVESSEPWQDLSEIPYTDADFVAKGQKDTMFVTAEEGLAKELLPSGWQPAFELAVPKTSPVDSLSTVASTYLARAAHSFASLYPWTRLETEADLDQLASFFGQAQSPAFAAIDLSNLDELHGTPFLGRLRDLLQNAIENDSFNVAVLTYPAPSSDQFSPRDDQTDQPGQQPFPQPSPQQPISAISGCFTTADACNNGTSSCSGHGQCVKATKAGRSCFVCSCGVTTTGEGSEVKTEYWAGQSCERKDISSQFVLFAGTGITILLLIVGATSLLYGVGDQPLPSTLLATAVVSKRD